MKIALTQVNTTVGDLAGNVARCINAVETASLNGADLVVLPEMVIPGYPPRDILYDSGFVKAVGAAAADLAEALRGFAPTIAGTIIPSGRQTSHHPGLYNTAVLLHEGKMRPVAYKQLLPVYDVFYEPRWFVPGPALPPLTIAGQKTGIIICEDMWDEEYDLHPPRRLLEAGAELLVCISASPYRENAGPERLHHARRHGCPLVHVNLVGANDELIFDGSSFAINAEGELLAACESHEETIQIVDIGTAAPITPQAVDPAEELFAALVAGVGDFTRKNGMRRVYVGLSGGIDSAVTAVIAAQALGPEQVTALAIPSRYTDPQSTQSAQELAERLGITFVVEELEAMHAAVEASLAHLLDEGTAAENIQARLRMMVLMSYTNRYGGMLLNPSNKTELALGYTTLYGDMAGTLSPLGDVTKMGVIRLAQWINREEEIVPQFILDREPTAELKPGQRDPFDYPEVSPEVERLVQTHRSSPAMRRAEHKRWQMGVILKVSRRAFGTGRMVPITRR